MTPTPPPRIRGLFARQAPVAVLFRRGPSRQVQLVKWNTADDTFEPGQWLKGRIYESRGDLSPDGKYLIYFAADHRYLKGPGSWTAISRPPILTALAFWAKGDCWNGGGLFKDGKTVLLNGGHSKPRVEPGCPLKFKALSLGRGEDDPIEEHRMRRDGWVLEQTMDVTRPPMPSLSEMFNWGNLPDDPSPEALADYIENAEIDFDALDKSLASPEYAAFQKGYTTHRPRILAKQIGDVRLATSDGYSGWTHYREYRWSRAGKEPTLLKGVYWAEFDQRGRVCFSREGAVFAIDPEATPDEARMLYDATGSTFAEMPPPDWAKVW